MQVRFELRYNIYGPWRCVIHCACEQLLPIVLNFKQKFKTKVRVVFAHPLIIVYATEFVHLECETRLIVSMQRCSCGEGVRPSGLH